jgi:FkbM family methyltransferase
MSLPVWLYWEGERPDWIDECYRTVVLHADNVHLITPEDFDTMREADRDIDISSLYVAHRADFIRAFLLAKYGGLWIDADCVVMKSLQPVLSLLADYDFVGYRERHGYVSNNFMGARSDSIIANRYYNRVCNILRSHQPIEWLTLGSFALSEVIKEAAVCWHEFPVEFIQPVCWSNPAAFFNIGNKAEHSKVFNTSSYCYMLSANMARGFTEANPSRTLRDANTFFNFLLQQSKKNADIMNLIQYRAGTDDDIWVIPEVIQQDMYRIKDAIKNIQPDAPAYVIDCGAHIGTFAIMCSMYLDNVEVIAFEPNPDSFLYLSKNADKFGNIEAHNKAVGVQDGTLTLYAPDQMGWSGRWTTTPNANSCLQVEAVNLLSFIRSLSKPVFMVKLDLEGYEELIINCATLEDLAAIRTIVLETHTDTFNHQKLRDAGFQLLFQPHISSARQFVYAREASIL